MKIKEITLSAEKVHSTARDFKYHHEMKISIEGGFGVKIREIYGYIELVTKEKIFRIYKDGNDVCIMHSKGPLRSSFALPFSELCKDPNHLSDLGARSAHFLSEILRCLEIPVPKNFQDICNCLIMLDSSGKFAVFSVGDDNIASLVQDSVSVDRFVEALLSSAPSDMYLRGENGKFPFPIETRKSSGESALDIAVANKNIEACKRLIGINILKHRKIGLLALMTAINTGYSEIISIIANAEWGDVEKQPVLNEVLRHAVSKKDPNIDGIGALLKLGADPNAKYDYGYQRNSDDRPIAIIDYKSPNAAEVLSLLLRYGSFILPENFGKAAAAQNVTALTVLSQNVDKLISVENPKEDQVQSTSPGPKFW